MKNAINWFELPATDFQRASKFYSTILGAELQPFDNGHLKMAFFPHEHEGVGGAIACGEGYKPQAEGPIIYLNGGDDLSNTLARVEPAGGKVVMPKTAIGLNGFIAIFLDTEGNRVGLHSMA